ncbi:bifunctional diguanylate cyclase/phosphodiesterase [Rhizobacter sp. Root1221]|uniref:putative bifunctional diguanylate cyclase/phosphodiesterase n=1 Tax=Rhizobacter sp. Root1221 TaxID=1736433 RepID=UPI0009E8E7BC|nr:EAL domain-containing protein [Rhizobacter sp. Root1221]
MNRLTTALALLKCWSRRSLGVRIVLLFLGLLLGVQALSFFAIRATIDRNARASIAESLESGDHLLQRLLEQNAQKLTQGASLLAADYGFRSALDGNDTETIASVLANHGDRIGATVSALLDTRFALRAAAQPGLEELQPAFYRLADRASSAKTASEIVMLGRRPFQLVLVPMRAPVVVGWVLMGFPIDRPLVDDMRDLSSLHVSLQVRDGAAARWVTAVSTLPASSLPLLESRDTPASLELADGEYSTRRVPLAVEHANEVSALLMRSVDEAVAPYRQLQLGLAALTLLGVVVFGVSSVLTARRVTNPIRRLAAAAERLGAGDYTTPLSGQHRADEIGELAQSFERMRISIADQQQEILKLAYWDTLTGLPNRVQFRNAVTAATEAARLVNRSVAVVMLDLDRFKHVNDVLGYEVGDLMLKAVADRLSQQAVRGGDLVARLDGDEFAVLLADLDPASDEALAKAVAQRINHAFDRSLMLSDQAVDINASIGIALWPHHADDTDTLLSRAEVAMYTSKRRHDGPNVYDAKLDAASSQTLSLLTELRHAVDHGELRLYLQPKLGLETARVVGAEALMRWQHPQRGLLPPMEFIPFAEQTGFVRVLTMWIFEEAARQWKVLQESGLQLTLSVNLSTRDLLDQELPQKFDALLMRHQVPAEAFCLEITESAIMDDPERALGTLERLHALGFRLSIDDFGTGYSSLAYLKRLPVDELKIDKSFVLSMERDLDDARIVRSTIDLAHGLGLSVVAEGVENAQSWELLRALRCDEAQGFHMSRPLPADEFLRWSMLWTARHAQPALPSGIGGARSITLH